MLAGWRTFSASAVLLIFPSLFGWSMYPARSATATTTPFNGGAAWFAGNSTANLVGGTPLSWNGPPAFASDAPPGALDTQSFQLSGANTLADPDTSVGNLGIGDFALGLDFRTTQSATNANLLTKQVDCSGTGQWLQVDLNDGVPYVQVTGPGHEEDILNATTTVSDGAWHLMEVVRHGDVIYLDLDGKGVTSETYTGQNPSNSAELTLGGGPCVGTPVGTAFVGELAEVYIGPGVTYSMSFPSGIATATPGGAARATLAYKNNICCSFAATFTSPSTARLSGLSGPGCNLATATCAYSLQGNGAPVTATYDVPSSAAPGSTLHGGLVTMRDLVLPLNPASTGWVSSGGVATIPVDIGIVAAPVATTTPRTTSPTTTTAVTPPHPGEPPPTTRPARGGRLAPRRTTPTTTAPRQSPASTTSLPSSGPARPGGEVGPGSGGSALNETSGQAVGFSRGPGQPQRSVLLQSIANVTQVDFSLKQLSENVPLSLLLILLVALPAAIFNYTFLRNHDQIMSGTMKIRTWFERLHHWLDALPSAVVITGFALIAGILDAAADPSFGLDRATISTVIGLTAAISLTVIARDLLRGVFLKTRYHRENRFRVLPLGLVLAAAMVVVARLAQFQPGYIFGLIAGLAFSVQPTEAEEGRSLALSSAWTLVLAVGCWLLWIPVEDHVVAGHTSFVFLVLDAFLATTWVCGVQGVLFSMVPIRFLHGERVMRWSRLGWLGIYAVTTFTFVQLIMHPQSGRYGGNRHAGLAGMLILFVAFLAIALAFWTFFRLEAHTRLRRPGKPHPTRSDSTT